MTIRTRMLVLVVTAAVVSVACGAGSGRPAANVSQGSSGSGLSVLEFESSLAAMHHALAPAIGSTRRAARALRGVQRSQSGLPAAVRAAGAAETGFGAASTELARVRLTAQTGPQRATAMRVSRHAQSAMRRLHDGLATANPASITDARHRLVRVQREGLAWSRQLDAIASRLGTDPPAWPSSLARRLGTLARAADVDITPQLHPGSTGMATVSLQRRLALLGYLPPGYETGIYDYRTFQAVTAFQGWMQISRDGIAGPETLARLRTATRPRPWSTGTRHMEIHIAQQVLLLVEGGRVLRAIHVSTAAPGHVTPEGTFAIYRKERMSWSVPFQVWMPYASYFTGGYALHEYPDVPPYPASHGCVRVPAGDALVVWRFATIGTPVIID